jgi:hypothetical protein
MSINEFLKTVYVGDRGCKSLTIDGWNSEVKLQVSCISRVRSKSWDYDDSEDLMDGFLVFEGVTKVAFNPTGPIPNDLINDVSVEVVACAHELERVTLSIDSVDAQGSRIEVIVQVDAKAVALEPWEKPGERIRT